MYELIENINGQIQAKIYEMKAVKAAALGLDFRAGFKLFVGDNCIAVSKRNDGVLQYYGGFEYIDEDCRTELGEYVIYFDEADRVRNCLEFLEETEEA